MRDLPWRGITDPYRIWISEIILQQTQVAQGLGYYQRFVERFPDVETLAAAAQDDVLRLWQGLGYYSRARNLHAAAKDIVQRGGFPTDYAGVRSLKGVGDYTAAAICSFAYGLPCAAIDGNAYRVFSRFLGMTAPIDTTVGKRAFAEAAAEFLDRKNPGVFNQAVMDFGAMQCTPSDPRCGECPLSDACRAFNEHQVSAYPVKARAVATRERHFIYVFARSGDIALLRQRTAGDIWNGLYEPPLIEFAEAPGDDEALRQIQSLFSGNLLNVALVRQDLKHVLTHQRLFVDFYKAELSSPALPGYIAVPTSEIDRYPVPRLIERLFSFLAL